MNNNPYYNQPVTNMTIREFMATMALAGILANDHLTHKPDAAWAAVMASKYSLQLAEHLSESNHRREERQQAKEGKAVCPWCGADTPKNLASIGVMLKDKATPK